MSMIIKFQQINKMNRCQHNEKISIFCVSQHCQWKDVAGCSNCMKKYHNHIGNPQFLNEQQLENILKKFVINHSYKPNCRAIQQTIFSYFGALKTQILNSIDLICKTVITQLGSPYLFQNHIFTVHKRIKNKQYKKINHKDFRKLYQISKKITFDQISTVKQAKSSVMTHSGNLNSLSINPTQNIEMTSSAASSNQSSKFSAMMNIDTLSREEGRIYKEHIKKNQKFINSMQTVMASYETLIKQLLQNFKHEKTNFDSLTQLIKKTLEISDPFTSITQFHEKQMQKLRAQKIDKIDKIDKEKHFNSQIVEKIILPLSKQNSSTRQSNTIKKNSQFQQKDSNIQENIKKLGTVNLSIYQKDISPTRKQILNQKLKKRQVSLDKKILFQDEQKKKAEIIFDEYRFGNDNKKIIPNNQIQKLIKSGQNNHIQVKKQSSFKNDQISQRKQQLIQMMKNSIAKDKRQNFNQNNHNEAKVNHKHNKSSILSLETNIHQNKNKNDILELYKINKLIQLDSPPKKRSLSGHPLQYQYNQKQLNQNDSKAENIDKIQNEANNLPQWSIKSIKNIKNIIQEDEVGSSSSIDQIKNLIQKNQMLMFAHSKLPIQERQQKTKQIGHSRVIIVPTGQKLSASNECQSPLLKKKSSTRGKHSESTKNRIQTQIFFITDQSPSKALPLNDNQQRSLNLLLKSIDKKPEEAINLLELAMKQAGNNLSAAQYLSFLYLQNQRPRQSLHLTNTILDKFLFTKDNQNELLNLENNKAAALNMLGRYSQAIVLLQKCLKVAEKDNLLKNIADAYYFNGNYQKAIYYYEKSIKLSPTYDEAYYNMSVCLYLQNNFHNAKMSILKALDINQSNSQYLELKRQIENRMNQSPSKYKGLLIN